MKIYEGPLRESAKDITFMYNADFFLYASLHHETDGMHGRPSPQNGPPVLTGMPVSSMILLDRPEEAGYFIFSDLSVRHEGRYFLSFALMEEVKEDRDMDIDETMSGTDEITGPEDGAANDRHFCFRTKVQTDVFDVFSAKKFPGLQESTALSRTVAEQGCRVRIRRDVRMRRREKGGKGKDTAAREEEFAPKPRVEASPQNHRGRSSSNDTSGTYQDMQRRQSGMEYASSRTSFAATETSSRQPPYGPVPPFPAHAQSMPNSPSYPPPQHGTHYQPRPPFGHYPSERSPTHPYGPPPPASTHRDSYPYRHEHPTLAPKLEADPDVQRLPPMRNFNGSAVEPRRPSYTPQPMARLMPHPPVKRDAQPEHAPYQLPPMVRPFDQRPSPPMAFAPPPPPPSRKRTAADAFEALSTENYRLQNGRRQEEQPRDANYRMEPPMLYRAPDCEPPSRQSQESRYRMSDPNYNRASDNKIKVDFPSLHG